MSSRKNAKPAHTTSIPVLDIEPNGLPAEETTSIEEVPGDTPLLEGITTGDLEAITINRDKHEVSPFAPIIRTPNFAHNSGNLTGFSVEIEDRSFPSGYRHLGNVSDNYLLLSNREVRELAVEIAVQSGLPFKESRIFWDGARFLHVIDFLQSEEVTECDEVGLGLITKSSYDQSWRYECSLMGKRFVCDNGMIAGEFFARIGFKHLKPDDESQNWREIVKAGLSMIDRAPEELERFAEGLRALRRAEMTDALLREVWPLFPTIGDGIKGQILSRYVSHEEATLYGFLNAGTNVFWHRSHKRMTGADFNHNDAFVSGLLGFVGAL